MEDEVMRFEITDQDLEEEMHSSYGKRRQSKNQAIYGVWADKSDSEDEGAGPSIGSFAGTKRNRSKVDYTAAMNFVSGGIQGKEKETKKSDIEDDEYDSQPPRREVESGGDSSEDERPSFGGGGFKSAHKQREAGRMEDAGQIAGMRTQNFFQPQSLGKGFGDWEKHTKGIGAKLLLKMGYQAGKGLGKNLQGRAQIVEAFVRKGKGAIGRYGPEGSRPKKDKVDSDDEEEKEFKAKLKQWKTVGEVGGKKRNAEYVYKSVEEVLEEGKFRKIKRDDVKTSTVKVIDMTGREERVLTGYQAISGQQRPDEDGANVKFSGLQGRTKANFELPELLHNLNLLVDLCEQDIIQADRKLIYHKDRVSVLESEGEKLSVLVEREKEQIESLEQIIAVIDRLEQKFVDGTLDMELALKAFRKLKEEFKKEFQEFELQYVASTIVVPLVKNSVSDWVPLAGKNDSIPHLTTFTQWKDILDEENNQYITQPMAGEPMPAYHTLVWECWVPVVRLAIQRWQSRVPDPLIGLLELWRPLLPNWVLQHVLEQLVLVRLQAEVDMWNPLTDTTPIHTWLHPWLPPLGNRLDIVYPTIRNKLSSALANWHPGDRSAKMILLPWKDVFTRGSMQAFLLKNIVPKIEAALVHIPINPINQDLSLWHAVSDWVDLIPPPALGDLMANNFFPRWLQVLAAWLNSNPNYNEVTGWYQGWKGVIPPPILLHPGVAEQLQQALHMMNRSVSGGGPMSQQPGALENVKYMTTREFETGRMPPAGMDVGNKNKFDTMSEAVRTSSQIPQGFKDLITRRCEERGIIFRPVPGRLREGKQIYLCGRQYCYLDRNVIFVQDDSRWVPTSLNSLLDNA